jgi:hypothetical protein
MKSVFGRAGKSIKYAIARITIPNTKIPTIRINILFKDVKRDTAFIDNQLRP